MKGRGASLDIIEIHPMEVIIQVGGGEGCHMGRMERAVAMMGWMEFRKGTGNGQREDNIAKAKRGSGRRCSCASMLISPMEWLAPTRKRDRFCGNNSA